MGGGLENNLALGVRVQPHVHNECHNTIQSSKDHVSSRLVSSLLFGQTLTDTHTITSRSPHTTYVNAPINNPSEVAPNLLPNDLDGEQELLESQQTLMDTSSEEDAFYMSSSVSDTSIGTP